jgi:hypothetical protein
MLPWLAMKSAPSYVERFAGRPSGTRQFPPDADENPTADANR